MTTVFVGPSVTPWRARIPGNTFGDRHNPAVRKVCILSSVMFIFMGHTLAQDKTESRVVCFKSVSSRFRFLSLAHLNYYVIVFTIDYQNMFVTYHPI